MAAGYLLGMPRAALLVSVSFVTCLGAGCPPEPRDTDVLSHLPKYEAQRQALCGRGRDNTVTRAFCGDAAPDVTRLEDVLALVGMPLDGDVRPGLALTGHSSSLVMRHVSAINPRAVFVELAEDRDDATFVGLGFTRGDQLVELAVKGPGREVEFYLLRYEQGCNDDDGGMQTCTPADLLTPNTESGWRRWSLYDDEDLNNSVFDCLQCHQPGGPGTLRSFRMQELQNPWTHWMALNTEGGATLMADFRAAHTDEGYAAIPSVLLGTSNPILVENLVQHSLSSDASFPSPRIEEEVQASSPAQPEDNRVPGRSATWEALYERAVAGEIIPPPYHDVKVTDPDKLAEMTAAYRAYRAGELTELPDIREVIADDAMRGMSLRPKAGLDGRGILIHACAQCHNGRLDQSLSRANFDAFRIDALTHEQREAAIARLRLPHDDRSVMPPPLFRTLSEDEIEACVDALRGG